MSIKQRCRYLCFFSVAGPAILVVLLGCPLIAPAQVAINMDGSLPHSSAMLDLKSVMGGVLIPRMTTAERTGIASPATGLLVFDTNTNTFWYYNGIQWEQLLVSASNLPTPEVITPALLTATAHNYHPTGFGSATIVRVSGNDGIQMITGFNGETNGEEKTITNIGNHPFYLAPEHTGSIAANRIAYFEEVMIPPGGSCRIIYDGTSARWRPIDPPCPNYTNLPRSVHYDKSAGKPPEGPSDDIHMGTFGPLPQSVALPSATSPFSSWYFNTGSATTGGMGFFYSKTTERMTFVGTAHIVGKMHIKTPSVLSDDTDTYYIFLRLAALPYTGFWDQNNSLGIRYRHNANNGYWQCYSRTNNTDVVLDTGLLCAVDTEYDLTVTLNKSNTEATYFINGVVVGRITTNLPAPVSTGPSNHLEKLTGTSARSMLVYRFMGAAIAP